MRLAISSAVLATLLCSSRVHAQAPRAATAGNPQLAASHYDTGSAEYRAGHFREAAAEFRLAYELSHEPALLFNIGSASFDAGDYAGAQDAFAEYLRAMPGAQNRAMVEGRLVTIRQHLAAVASPSPSRSPSPAPHASEAVPSSEPRARPQPAPPESRGVPVAPVVTALVGVVGVALGTVFLVVRGNALQSCTELPDAFYCPNAGTASNAAMWSTATNVAFIGGGIILLGGAAWLVVSQLSTPHSTRPGVGAIVAPGLAALTVGGRF